MNTWDFAMIKQRCVTGLDDNVGTTNDNGDGNDDNEDEDDAGNATTAMPAGSGSHTVKVYSGGCATTAMPAGSGSHTVKVYSGGCLNVKGKALVIKSNKRYAHGKRLFDEIAVHFTSNDIFTSFVEVMRAVIVTCTSGNTEAGFVRIKNYITVDPHFQKLKTIEPTLLPTINVKQGRSKKNNRGEMVRELRVTPRQCTFCLSRNPVVHRVGTKCKPLMAKRINFELSGANFTLISTTKPATASNLISYSGTKQPIFVQVLNKPVYTDNCSSTDESVQEHIAYICTLYVHATDCLGTFIGPTSTIADWTAQTTCRVYISASDQLRKAPLSNDTEAKRKHVSAESGSTVSINHINLYVQKLHNVWQKRLGQQHETWEESRIGRITGTSAKIVMTGKISRRPSSCQRSLDCQRFTRQRKCRLEMYWRLNVCRAIASKTR